MRDRDWVQVMGGFGILLITGVATLCALLVVAACIYLLVTEGQLGYLLLAPVALGFGCIFASGIKWAVDLMRDA